MTGSHMAFKTFFIYFLSDIFASQTYGEAVKCSYLLSNIQSPADAFKLCEPDKPLQTQRHSSAVQGELKTCFRSSSHGSLLIFLVEGQPCELRHQ